MKITRCTIMFISFRIPHMTMERRGCTCRSRLLLIVLRKAIKIDILLHLLCRDFRRQRVNMTSGRWAHSDHDPRFGDRHGHHNRRGDGGTIAIASGTARRTVRAIILTVRLDVFSIDHGDAIRLRARVIRAWTHHNAGVRCRAWRGIAHAPSSITAVDAVRKGMCGSSSSSIIDDGSIIVVRLAACRTGWPAVRELLLLLGRVIFCSEATCRAVAGHHWGRRTVTTEGHARHTSRSVRMLIARRVKRALVKRDFVRWCRRGVGIAVCIGTAVPRM